MKSKDGQRRYGGKLYAMVCKELDKYMQDKIDDVTSNHSFSAIMVDIDDFKSINDRFCHYEGDIALTNTANILRSSV